LKNIWTTCTLSSVCYARYWVILKDGKSFRWWYLSIVWRNMMIFVPLITINVMSIIFHFLYGPVTPAAIFARSIIRAWFLRSLKIVGFVPIYLLKKCTKLHGDDCRLLLVRYPRLSPTMCFNLTCTQVHSSLKLTCTQATNPLRWSQFIAVFHTLVYDFTFWTSIIAFSMYDDLE
jgi:hypothetical protein